MALVLSDYYLEHLPIHSTVPVLDSSSRPSAAFVCSMYVSISTGSFFLGLFGEDSIIWFLRAEFGGLPRFLLTVHE